MSSMNVFGRGCLALAGFTALLGCSSVAAPEKSSSAKLGDQSAAPEVEAPEASASEEFLLLTVKVDGEHSVSFYEPVPGGIMMVEHMDGDQDSITWGHPELDALDVYKLLRPGEAVPDVLQQAYDRSLSRNFDDVAFESQGNADIAPAFGGGNPADEVSEGEVLQGSDDTIGVVRQADSSSSAKHFVNDHDGCKWGNVYEHCRVNWANGFWASSTSDYIECRVDHYNGNGVKVRFTIGSNVVNWNLAAGHENIFSVGTTFPRTTRRADVLNATGDRFHVGCNWRNF